MVTQRVDNIGQISIHVPREGDDFRPCAPRLHVSQFLSTSPARGTTAAAVPLLFDLGISIHVPREGDDGA